LMNGRLNRAPIFRASLAKLNVHWLHDENTPIRARPSLSSSSLSLVPPLQRTHYLEIIGVVSTLRHSWRTGASIVFALDIGANHCARSG
jgi:hypothetical protein